MPTTEDVFKCSSEFLSEDLLNVYWSFLQMCYHRSENEMPHFGARMNAENSSTMDNLATLDVDDAR